MSSRIFQLPRQILKKQDEDNGQYSVVSRNVSDGRKGKENVVPFFDNKTIFFIQEVPSGSFVENQDVSNYPRKVVDRSFGDNSGQFPFADIASFWSFQERFFRRPVLRIISEPALGSALHAIGEVNKTGASKTELFFQTNNNRKSLPIQVQRDQSISSSFIFNAGTDSDVFSVGKLCYALTNSVGLDALSFGDSLEDSPFSISVWCKLGEINDDLSIICAKSDSQGFEWRLFYDHANERLEFGLNDDSAARTLRVRSHYSASKIGVQGVWNHIVATYDATESAAGIFLYINGNELSTDRVAAAGYIAMENSGSGFYVGGNGHSGSNFDQFNGEILDLVVLNREINHQEINDIYAGQTGVSMPSGLPAYSQYLNSVELMSDIVISKNVVPGVFDQYVPNTDELPSLPAFKDHLRIEDSSKFINLSGTSPEDWGKFGFNQSLRSKSQIIIELGTNVTLVGGQQDPVAFSFNFETSRLAYFDARSEVRGFSNIGSALIPSSTTNVSHGWDSILMHPFGFPQQSGSINGSGSVNGIYNPHLQASVFGSNENNKPTSKTIGSALSFIQSQSCLLDNEFIASDNQKIKMSNYISEPFLLEKVILKIPVAISASWFDLRTVANASGFLSNTRTDSGGPGMFFGLMRQEDTKTVGLYQSGTSQRYLICSGTVIPEGDDTTFINPGFDSSATLVGLSTVGGFTTYATPSVIIPAPIGGEQYITSTLEIVMEPAVTNGLLCMDFANTTNEVFRRAGIKAVSPFGRNGNGELGDRDLYVKGLQIAGDDKKVLPYDNSVYTADVDHYTFFKNNVSPYVLNPDDNLILFATSHRRCKENLEIVDLLTGSTTDFNLLPRAFNNETNSFESVGPIIIKMYGTFVSNNESNDNNTLNQYLTTLGVHEPIGAGPILDQFMTERNLAYTGSYIDEHFSGSMFVTTSLGDVGLVRRRVGTANNGLNFGVTGSLLRGVKLISEERYYDSLIPSIADVSIINGASVRTVTTGVSHPIKLIVLGGYADGIFNPPIRDTFWLNSFPFEPRYSGINRIESPFSVNLADLGFSSNVISIAMQKGYDPAATDPPQGIVDMAAYNKNDKEGIEVILRSYYGIGDRTIIDNNTGSQQVFTYVGAPRFRGTETDLGGSTNIYERQDVGIRGWKYGLINGFDYNSSAVFRHDRYGQFRDMLEQRHDTKFHTNGDGQSLVSGKTLSSPISIKFSKQDPADTFSSNLSFEATSSLPYFDGEARNRPDLPSLISV